MDEEECVEVTTQVQWAERQQASALHGTRGRWWAGAGGLGNPMPRTRGQRQRWWLLPHPHEPLANP